MKLSVIVITKNEEKHIRRCLDSVRFADEIVILDSGSEDATLEICQEFTSQIFSTDWPGFGPQKNRALAKTSHDWVLAIDGDEWLSPELMQEIQTLLASKMIDHYDGYCVRRLSEYCGHFIRFGAWKNDYIIRLFKKSISRYSNDIIHERVIVNGKIKTLNHPLYHQPFENLEQSIQKMNDYTTLSAQMKFQQGKKGSIGKAILHGLWTFIRSYFLKCGFLDGKAGFLLAVATAEGSYYRYAKLWLLRREHA